MKLLAIRRRTRFVRSTRKRGRIPRSRVGLTRREVCAPSLTHSRTYLLAHSLTHSRIHLLTRAFTYSLAHALTHLLAHFLRALCEGLVRVQQVLPAQVHAISRRRAAAFGLCRFVHVRALRDGRTRRANRGLPGRRSTRRAGASTLGLRPCYLAPATQLPRWKSATGPASFIQPVIGACFLGCGLIKLSA